MKTAQTLITASWLMEQAHRRVRSLPCLLAADKVAQYMGHRARFDAVQHRVVYTVSIHRNVLQHAYQSSIYAQKDTYLPPHVGRSTPKIMQVDMLPLPMLAHH